MDLNFQNAINNITQNSIINLGNYSIINNEKIIHKEFNGKVLFFFTTSKIYYFKNLGKKDKYECIKIRLLEDKFSKEENQKYEIDNIIEFMDTIEL